MAVGKLRCTACSGARRIRIAPPVQLPVIDLCSSEDSEDEMVVLSFSTGKSVIAAVTDADPEEQRDLSFAALPPATEEEREFMHTVMLDLFSDNQKQAPSAEKQKTCWPEKLVEDSFEEEDEDGITECLSDLELSEVAQESEDDEVDDADEMAQLCAFVGDIPCAPMSRKEQRLVRGTCMRGF